MFSVAKQLQLLRRGWFCIVKGKQKTFSKRKALMRGKATVEWKQKSRCDKPDVKQQIFHFCGNSSHKPSSSLSNGKSGRSLRSAIAPDQPPVCCLIYRFCKGILRKAVARFPYHRRGSLY